LEGSLCTSPQGELELLSPFDGDDGEALHAEPATRIAKTNAVVERSAKRARH
jgi:hypothetical protein